MTGAQGDPDQGDAAAPRPPFPRRIFLAAGLCAAATLVTALTADRAAIGLNDSLPPWADAMAREVTSFGKSGWILTGSAIIAGLGWFAGRNSVQTVSRALFNRIAIESAGLFVAVAGSGLTANLAKRIIGRPRPPQFDEAGLWGLHPFSGSGFESFPSGHSTTAGATIAFLALIWPRWTVPLILAGASVAASRVLLSAHHPSDVVAGFGYGICFSLWLRSAMIRRGYLAG